MARSRQTARRVCPARWRGQSGSLRGERSRSRHHAVLSLGAAAYLFREPGYAARAASVLHVWFVEPKTRMNPNLEYGQAIRGVTEGRGIGIIDTRPLIRAAQGIAFLGATGGWDRQDRDAVHDWYRDYIRWLTTSKKGLDEKNAGNNHATWWTAQVAAYAALVSDAPAKRMAWDWHRKHLLLQFNSNGAAPHEEARTKSLSYTAMNLGGFALLCRLAQADGQDLWRATNAGSVRKAIAYALPYLREPGKGTSPQIAAFKPGGHYFLALAGLGLRSRELIDAHRRVAKSDNTWAWLIEMSVALARER